MSPPAKHCKPLGMASVWSHFGCWLHNPRPRQPREKPGWVAKKGGWGEWGAGEQPNYRLPDTIPWRPWKETWPCSEGCSRPESIRERFAMEVLCSLVVWRLLVKKCLQCKLIVCIALTEKTTLFWTNTIQRAEKCSQGLASLTYIHSPPGVADTKPDNQLLSMFKGLGKKVKEAITHW